jgi:hypothetical protein
MKRWASILIVFIVTTFPVYSQAWQQTRKDYTWYEQALRHLNPNNIDYGSIWEQRKRAILNGCATKLWRLKESGDAVSVLA